ncbi:MAG: potassium-transporting ATPase subunit KdpA [Pseudomonadota bacterium]|nr:potassium-transporting ATPase subunit KdpA [Pseudomonadota bacterium]MDE3037092.1 potassium-transporting ATPase subunit KdpA [Pseudomonadota bacterium]
MSSAIVIILCLGAVAACIKPLGLHMARVFSGHVWLERPLGWLERLIYRVCGVNPEQDMSWRGYAAGILLLGLAGFLFLFAIFSGQACLPLNPQKFAGLAPGLAFNAAVSFLTNTNWQSYSGEANLSYLSQMAGCAVQNFLSAATGMAVAVALFRSLSRKQTQAVGNPYADVVRGVLYILLPMAFVFAIFLASQGVVDTLDGYVKYTPVEVSGVGCRASDKKDDSGTCHPSPDTLIALGPVASQVAIKMLGSNGGGFFNANAAHPFENPTPLSNLLQIISILLLPAAFAYTFGVMAGDRRQGWMLVAAMAIIFIPLMMVGVVGEQRANPRFDAHVFDNSAGNMEGKETRFGAGSSALWAAATAATSNGSVNSMHDSFMPLSGMVPLLLIQFGEVIYGGLGSGAYGMLMFVLLTVFIGGLMVGRTPEYLGKKIGAYEIKMASLVILVPASLVLAGTAVAVMTEAGRAGLFNPGAQGFSEILYGFSSAANNNGSAFAGLSANTPFYNIALGLCMFIGRYWVIVPVLAIAGSLAGKNTVPVSAGTMPTHTPLFTFLLIGTVIIIGVLTFVPALALGPIAEHMHLVGAP